jgi:hypothetical protein
VRSRASGGSARSVQGPLVHTLHIVGVIRQLLAQFGAATFDGGTLFFSHGIDAAIAPP